MHPKNNGFGPIFFKGSFPIIILIPFAVSPYLCHRQKYWSRSIMDITWVSGTQDLRSIRDGITFTSSVSIKPRYSITIPIH